MAGLGKTILRGLGKNVAIVDEASAEEWLRQNAAGLYRWVDTNMHLKPNLKGIAQLARDKGEATALQELKVLSKTHAEESLAKGAGKDVQHSGPVLRTRGMGN